MIYENKKETTLIAVQETRKSISFNCHVLSPIKRFIAIDQAIMVIVPPSAFGTITHFFFIKNKLNTNSEAQIACKIRQQIENNLRLK